ACLALLAAVLASILSCSGGGSGEVVFWQFWPAEMIDPLIQKFARENPAIRVRMEQLTWDSGKARILAAVASGNVPDLCELGSTYLPRFLASGSLSDWSAGVADLKGGIRGWEMCSIGEAIDGL